MRRVIDTWKGKRPALAKSLDFVYMRTLYPLGDKTEDGFIFLSDAWLRFLTGPRLRIGQKRRIETVTSLEMIKNAALFYLWENPGSKVPDFKTLQKRGYLDKKQLYTEPGDRLSWNPKRFAASSKRYGRLGHLTPNLDLSVDKVTKLEKQEYLAFRRFYQDYWRRYFDPIGIRVSAAKDISMQVTILPLIDNSEYNRTKGQFGGQAVNQVQFELFLNYVECQHIGNVRIAAVVMKFVRIMNQAEQIFHGDPHTSQVVIFEHADIDQGGYAPGKNSAQARTNLARDYDFLFVTGPGTIVAQVGRLASAARDFEAAFYYVALGPFEKHYLFGCDPGLLE